jgi:hypothetical protein
MPARCRRSFARTTEVACGAVPALHLLHLQAYYYGDMKEKSPELQRTKEQLDQFAWLLDNCFQIPGLRWRFGLESVLGLVPGLGDIISGILALFLMIRAIQFRLPWIVIARMALNSLIDLVVGAIPFAGDLFDAVWKANTRNMQLFHAYAEEPELSTRRHWFFIVGLVSGFVLCCLGIIAGTIWILSYFFNP